MSHDVTFIPGDGTGPELAEATRRVLEATGVEFTWDEHRGRGVDEYEADGNPFPDRTLDSIQRTGVGIKGPTTTPVGSGFRSVNVLLRKELDLYACIRPCKAYEGVRTRFPETDIVIVRENTEDLYAGIEFERGTPRTPRAAPRARQARRQGPRATPASRSSRSRCSARTRIVRAAFDYAQGNGRRKVTAAHKANIMKFSDGLFLETARKVAERLPGHRVRGPDHRQPLQPARLAPGGVRRDRAAQPLRRHRVRPRRGHDRRPRPGARAATSAPRRRCSRPPTARRPSTRARTRSTRRR